MVTIKNPISTWLNEGKQKALEAEAKAKIRITDYTNWKFYYINTILILLVILPEVKKDL